MDQFGMIMYSKPPPAVQPTAVLLPAPPGIAPPFSEPCRSPTARPPVTYGRRLLKANPSRPRTVPSASSLAVQLSPKQAPPPEVEPLMSAHDPSPSRPNTTLLTCQLYPSVPPI